VGEWKPARGEAAQLMGYKYGLKTKVRAGWCSTMPYIRAHLHSPWLSSNSLKKLE
jgi:ribosome modulation factor